MKKLLLKLSPNAKRVAPILTVVLLMLQIPNQGITLLAHFPVLQRLTGAS
jgi:hypothetical protein